MEKIAIIGLSCLFPDAQSATIFWENLVEGKTATSQATQAEFGIDPDIFYAPNKGEPDKTYCLKGGFIREFRLDPTGYALSPKTIERLDPLAKSALYVAKQALQDSGYWRHSSLRTRCGVVVGNMSLPTRTSYQRVSPLYQQVIESSVQQLLQCPDFHLSRALTASDRGTHFDSRVSSLPSAIVARALALSETHFSLDAAYASSLYAIKLASHYLQAGRADLMLAGATSYVDPLFIRMLFAGVQALPDNGVSCPFDERSRGLTPADGAGMVVLKRYGDAVRDGDKIYATIASVGLSNDGLGKHLLRPNSKGQITAFDRAYREANLSPRAIDYIECHATGTPLGDATELQSLRTFLDRYQAHPLLGAAKANVGHLLTAAGMVSLLKVVLSMRQGLIPPTLNLTAAEKPTGLMTDSEQIVQQLTAWPEQPTRRGAINAFGFGGTNAHLVVEHPPEQLSGPSPTGPLHPIEAVASFSSGSSDSVPYSPVAIIGMDTFFGGCDGLDAFDRTLYDGIQQFRPLPPHRWQGIEQQDALLTSHGLDKIPEGAYIDQFEVDTRRFKVPPHSVQQLQPQQLLLLKVADRALQDAGLAPGGNVAVVVAMEMDPSLHQRLQRWHLDWQLEAGLTESGISLDEDALADLKAVLKDSLHPVAKVDDFISCIGNITASRVAALWDFDGPAFTLSAAEQSMAKALEVAQILLDQGEVEAVLVGAVDLAGGFEQVLAQQKDAPVNAGMPTWSYDQQAQGQVIGEGAGAIVLRRLEQAKAAKDRVYAVVDAIGLAQATDTQLTPERVTAACQQAHARAGTRLADVGYLEVCSQGISTVDTAEIEGLTQVYRGSDSAKTCAIGSVTANVGYAGVAAGMASLIKTALCLYHRYLPSVPGWSAPQQAEQWQGSPFYVAQRSRSWALGSCPARRVAAVNLATPEMSAHILLSETAAQVDRPSRYLEQKPFYLLAIATHSPDDLRAKLGTLQTALSTDISLMKLAQQTFVTYQKESHLPYTLTLVGGNRDALQQELTRATEGGVKAFETGKDWQTPGGSFFTLKPQGRTGQVAFVYPGAFSAYVRQGQDQLRLFPSLHHHPMLQSTGDRYASLDRLLYPRTLKAPSRRQLEALDKRLLSNPLAMFEAEMACAGFTTAILQDYFDLRPQMAFGYSLGETSMMVAQGVFDAAEFGQGSRSLEQSPLFGDRLSGPRNAVRDCWGLLPVSTDEEEDLWGNYVLMAPIPEIRRAIQSESRVYLTQINTDHEGVIAGHPDACSAVIKKIGCPAFQAPFDHVIHCPPVATEQTELEKLNTFSIRPVPDVSFYSAAAYGPIAQDGPAISRSIAQNLCQTLDFPRLVNRVHDDGARIFIEVGAGGTCSRWISTILKDRPHLTTPLNLRGMDDHTALVRTLARLVSHQVPLTLAPLYGSARAPQAAVSQPDAIVKTVQVGRPSIAEAILSDANRVRFRDAAVTKQSVSVAMASQTEPTQVLSIAPAPTLPACSSAAVSPVSPPAQQTHALMGQAHATFLCSRKAALQHLRDWVSQTLAIAEVITAGSTATATATDSAAAPDQAVPSVPDSIPELIRR